jgi:hydrogenase-4 component B
MGLCSSRFAGRVPTPAGGDIVLPVSDPILLFLAVDAVALLLVGACAGVLPPAGCAFLVSIASGLGVLLCLPPLLMRSPATALGVPVGPPGLPVHLALDSLSAFFLLIVFLASFAIAIYQATAVPLPRVASMRMTALGLAGTALVLLAGDGVALAIGLAVACGSIWLPSGDQPQDDRVRRDRRRQAVLLVPLLVLVAVCLLAPSGFAPRFDAIRAAPADPEHAVAAAVLTVAAVAGLAHARSTERCWTRDALAAGVVIPAGSYLLLRLIADLSGGTTQTVCGFGVLLAGGSIAVVQAWRAVGHPDMDGSVACLMRREAGLAMVGVGLALIARAADLPGATCFALTATLLTGIGGCAGGVLTSLAAHAMGASAGTYRLSRLGGLVHAMPGTSAAMAAGLLGLSAMPPGLGFAVLWLLFQAILSAPRTGGLLFQLPLALTGGALALSAAATATASVRLIGVAVLGRPRTPVGAGAQESRSASRTILLIGAALSVLVGILPGPVLWLLAVPAIRALTGTPPGGHIGLAVLSASAASPGYLALPVSALLLLAGGAAILVPGWSRKEGKAAVPWAGGMQPPVGLPFGAPAAQSVGEGFLPTPPGFVPVHALARPLAQPQADFPVDPLIDAPADPLVRLPRVGVPRLFRAPSATRGMWLLLTAFGTLLLFLTVLQ